MKSIRSFLIPLCLFLLTIAGSVVLQNRMIDRWHKTPQRFRDTLYIPSGAYARVVSLGYNQFAADFLWLRMIQVFAASWSSAESPTQIRTYSEVISELDPRFTDPYSFAIMGIGEEGRTQAKICEQVKQEKNEFGVPYLKVKEVDKIVTSIVDMAIVKNPGNYRVPFDGFFFAYYNLNDPVLAKYYVRMAKKDPNYPDYIERWEGYLDVKQGRYRAAYERFLADYINAIRAKNKDLYSIIRMHLNRSVNDWFISEILQRAQEWKKTRGQWPTVEDLRRAGAFKGVELPDMVSIHNHLIDMLNGDESPVKTDAEINKLAQDNIKKWDDLPPGPFDLIDPRFRGYVIWRTRQPGDEKFILPVLEALGSIRTFIKEVNTRAAHDRNPKTGVYPPFSDFEADLTLTDPFGNPWTYDRTRGVLSDPTYPGIENQDIPDIYMKQ